MGQQDHINSREEGVGVAIERRGWSASAWCSVPDLSTYISAERRAQPAAQHVGANVPRNGLHCTLQVLSGVMHPAVPQFCALDHDCVANALCRRHAALGHWPLTHFSAHHTPKSTCAMAARSHTTGTRTEMSVPKQAGRPITPGTKDNTRVEYDKTEADPPVMDYPKWETGPRLCGAIALVALSIVTSSLHGESTEGSVMALQYSATTQWFPVPDI